MSYVLYLQLNDDLWLGSLNGKEGVFPYHAVRELKTPGDETPGKTDALH